MAWTRSLMLAGILVFAAQVYTDDSCADAVTNCVFTASTSQDSCLRMSSQVACLSGTDENNCTVDGNLAAVRPICLDVCNELGVYSNCSTYTNCFFGTIYFSTVNIDIISGPTPEQIGNVTSTAFWCRFLRESVGCFENHGCGDRTPSTVVTSFQSRQFWLEVTCNGQDNVTSYCKPSMTQCIIAPPTNNQCSNVRKDINCVASTSCDRFENAVGLNFDVLADVVNRVCSDVEAVRCAAREECVNATYYALIPGRGSLQGVPGVVLTQLLNTRFWCSFVTQTYNCYVHTSGKCGLNTEAINRFTENHGALVKKWCPTDDGNPGGLNSDAASVSTSTIVSAVLFLAATLHFS